MGLCKPVNETTSELEEGDADESGKEETAGIESGTESGTISDAGESDEERDEETTKHTKTETWSEKLREIRRSANKFEKDLISCVVNPGNFHKCRIYFEVEEVY